VQEGKFTTRRDIYFLDKEGKEQVWEAVGRNMHVKTVSIFALTANREVILEKIFRVPFNGYVLELPAGLGDREGESAEELARRELLEETGYQAQKMTLLMHGPYNAGLLSDEMMLFFAPNAEKIAEPQLEPAEDLEVILVPLDKLVDFLTDSPKQGIPADLKILSALPVLQNRGLI